MLKIGRLTLNGTPRVAVSLKDGTPSRALSAMRRAGVDLVELRVDLFRSCNLRYVLREITRMRPFPVLATIRSAREGGRWTGADASRAALYEKILPHVDAIDVELSSKMVLARVARAARKARKTLILSFHDFDAMPPRARLDSILRSAKRAGADAVKIAARARRPEDLRTLGAFTLAHSRQGLITIAMGKEGGLSRVLFPALGSLITFASYGRPMAPGQLDFETTLNRLRHLGLRLL